MKELKKKLEITKKQCQGAITDKEVVIYKYSQPELREVNELFCVIANYKPLVMINNDWQQLYQHSNLITEIINVARKNGVMAIVYYDNNIRNIIGYKKKNRNRAIFVQYIQSTKRGKQLKTHYLSGKSLGYSDKNIKAFYKRIKLPQSQFNLDKKNYRSVQKLIKNSKDYKQFASLSRAKEIKFPHIF